MTFDTDLLEVMTSTPLLLPQGGPAQYGRRAYGSPVPMRAYWVAGGSTTEGSEGESANTSGTLYLPPPAYWPDVDPPFAPFTRFPTVDDGLELPDGSRPTIAKVTVYRDEDGEYGAEVEYA